MGLYIWELMGTYGKQRQRRRRGASGERGNWKAGHEVSLRFAAKREAANQGIPFAPSTRVSGPTSRVVCLNPIEKIPIGYLLPNMIHIAFVRIPYTHVCTLRYTHTHVKYKSIKVHRMRNTHTYTYTHINKS